MDDPVSFVTDLVFIATTSRDATAFQDAFEQHQKYRPHPLDSADHCTSLWVFHIGVDYMNPDLYAWLKIGPPEGWTRGTVLFMHGECDEDPDITVWPTTQGITS